MERLAAVLLALAAAHPGHDGPDQEPPAIRPTGAEVHTPAADLAATLLDRGQAGLAVRLVARDAPSSARAARVLAAALEELDDPVGARIARERADRLDAEVTPRPPTREVGPPAAAEAPPAVENAGRAREGQRPPPPETAGLAREGGRRPPAD